MREPTVLCLTCGKMRRKMATVITCQPCIRAVVKENERLRAVPTCPQENRR